MVGSDAVHALPLADQLPAVWSAALGSQRASPTRWPRESAALCRWGDKQYHKSVHVNPTILSCLFSGSGGNAGTVWCGYYLSAQVDPLRPSSAEGSVRMQAALREQKHNT